MVQAVQLETGEICDRRVCCHCHNPLPSGYGRNTVKFISVIGVTGSGKTVYLSQLLKGINQYMARVGLAVHDTNASAGNFVRQNMIKEGVPFPGSTPAGRLQQPLFFDVTRSTSESTHSTETFVLYDVAGELFDPQKFNPSQLSRFAPFIRNSDGIILLIDPSQFSAFNLVAGKINDQETQQALTGIYNMVVDGGGDSKCEKPLAVCISKMDEPAVQQALPSEELRIKISSEVQPIKDEKGNPLPLFNVEDYNPISDELSKFFRNQESSLVVNLRANYKRYCYFGLTSLGCEIGENDNNQKYPIGPIIPKRIEEPLLWLLYEFGYIGKKPGCQIHIDGVDIIKCPNPNCGGEDYEIRVKTKGILMFKRTYKYKHCNSCEHDWDEQEIR
ncbi:hypothetical protein P261_00363 [Lachnospiraceae bacterium TWA4]|nr:hypothetical protein P261_00363 [Lachnospiraceae bacterium TWA4]